MPIIKILRRKTASFSCLPLWVQIWFFPVTCLLGLAKLLIVGVSFRRVAPRLGAAVGATAWVPLLDPTLELRALQIGRVIRLAASFTPWHSNCFPQAVVARLLLGVYGIPYALHFGLMRDAGSGEMKAHAWVVAGRVRVTGGSSFDQFKTVACFVAPQLRSVFDA